MIVVAKGGGQAMKALFKVRVIPPRERVGSKPFEKSKDGEKSGYSDNKIDKLPELGPGSKGMDDQVVNA